MKTIGMIFFTILAIIGLLLACSGSEYGMKETPYWINIIGLGLFGFACTAGSYFETRK